MTGMHPPIETHPGQVPYPSRVHNSGQVAGANVPGACSRNAAGSHSQNQHFGVTGNTGPQVESSGGRLPRTDIYQHSQGTQQHHFLSADCSGHQPENSVSNSVVNRTQPSQQNTFHIVKPAVLHPEAAG